METQLPPKVLVRTWLSLITKPDTSSIRRGLVEGNIVRIFGSINEAQRYVADIDSIS